MSINKLNNNQIWLQFILPIFLLIVGLNIIYLFDCFKFDTDEGFNLMKAFLVNNDYRLYQEIWNDQPPILTHLLAFSFRVFEPNIEFSRTIILLFSTFILWQTWLILYRLGGSIHAWIGSLLLLISPNYLRLSVGVMVGLPCLSLAMGAVTTIIQWHLSKKKIWLIVSALLLSLSITTKLFTFFLAPIIVIGIFIEQNIHNFKNSKSKKLRWQLPALWIAVFLGSTFLILFTLVGIDNIHYLIDNHTSARSVDVFQEINLKKELKNNYLIFLSCFTSWATFIAYQRKQWCLFYFTAWLITAFVLLAQHKPVWYHHMILIHIPALILVGYAIGEIITKVTSGQSFLRQWKQKKILTFIAFAIVVGCVLLIGEQTKKTYRTVAKWQVTCGYENAPDDLRYSIVEEISQLSPQTNWILTDLPMYAFRSGISVPPPVAVLSLKQLQTGIMVEQDIVDVINQYQPEQVLLGRFEWNELTEFLSQNYQLKTQKENYRLYVKKELL